MKRSQRFVVWVSLTLSALALVLMLSPGLMHGTSRDKVFRRFAVDPTPENRLAAEQARREAQHRQLTLGAVAIGLLVFGSWYDRYARYGYWGKHREAGTQTAAVIDAEKK